MIGSGEREEALAALLFNDETRHVEPLVEPHGEPWDIFSLERLNAHIDILYKSIRAILPPPPSPLPTYTFTSTTYVEVHRRAGS